jgi:hypothetical protein
MHARTYIHTQHTHIANQHVLHTQSQHTYVRSPSPRFSPRRLPAVLRPFLHVPPALFCANRTCSTNPAHTRQHPRHVFSALPHSHTTHCVLAHSTHHCVVPSMGVATSGVGRHTAKRAACINRLMSSLIGPKCPQPTSISIVVVAPYSAPSPHHLRFNRIPRLSCPLLLPYHGCAIVVCSMSKNT